MRQLELALQYQAIIFDFDGVLIDSEPLHFQACNEVFRSIGFTIPKEEYFSRYVGMSDPEMFDLILGERNIRYQAEQVQALRKNKIKAFNSIINTNDNLSGVSNVYEFIKSYADLTNHIAICSGAMREEIETMLNKLERGELRPYFKEIVTIDDISIGKPSPEGYLLTAKRLNINPNQCIAIEDTPKGIHAAKSAGMTVVALTTTHHPAQLTHANYVANNYQEIDSWLKAQL